MTNLQGSPVLCDDNPDIFAGGHHRDNDPGENQTFTLRVSPGDENDRGQNTKEGVKHRVFDQGSNTDVLVLALLTISVMILGVLDNVEDGDDEGDGQLR